MTGALWLTPDEVADFERWMIEPVKPTSYQLEAAKAYNALLQRQRDAKAPQAQTQEGRRD